MEKLYKSGCKIDFHFIQGISPNNVDFHLSFYLGKYSAIAPADVLFSVYSKDKGYDNLILTIDKMERFCIKMS